VSKAVSGSTCLPVFDRTGFRKSQYPHHLRLFVMTNRQRMMMWCRLAHREPCLKMLVGSGGRLRENRLKTSGKFTPSMTNSVGPN